MSDFSLVSEILAELTPDDVNAAIAQIDLDGVPSRETSKNYCIAAAGRHYSPRLVIGYAAAFAFSEDFYPENRLQSADLRSNDVVFRRLRELGFEILPCACGGKGEMPKKGTSAQRARVSRLIVAGRTGLRPSEAVTCLRQTLSEMKRAKQPSELLMTPGGFIAVDLPFQEAKLGWDSPASALARVSIRVEAKLTKMFRTLAKQWYPEMARFITLGVDASFWEFGRAELVATFDTCEGRVVQWTGSTFPKPGEQSDTLLITDLGSHFQLLGNLRFLVLRSHDVDLFRGSDSRGDHRTLMALRSDAMLLAKAFKPQIVLTHSHVVVRSVRAQRASIDRLSGNLSNAKYVESFAFGRQSSLRGLKFTDYLKNTKSADARDFVWRGQQAVARSARS